VDRLAAALRRRAVCQAVEGGEERYILAAGIDDLSVKVRGGKLEIKCLQVVHQRLERWMPSASAPFPLSPNFLASAVLPALRVDHVELRPWAYGADELFDEVVQDSPNLCAVRVFKRRHLFELDRCKAEIVAMHLDGVAVCSVAAESADPEALTALIGALGMDGHENVNYPRALRRLVDLQENAGRPNMRRDTKRNGLVNGQARLHAEVPPVAGRRGVCPPAAGQGEVEGGFDREACHTKNRTDFERTRSWPLSSSTSTTSR